VTTTTAEDAAQSVEVVERFMRARNDHDTETATRTTLHRFVIPPPFTRAEHWR
jgi:hypothetical protein